MPKTGKTARGEKSMNKTGAASKPTEAPLLREAALSAALQAFANAPSGPGGSSAGGGATGGPDAQGQAAPPPKTVSQVLGEITWLMTQSPRHKSIPLGDLEWLVMPAVLLQQFRMFYKGEQP